MVRNLEDVDLNLLVALDALLQERHVTRAAQRLQIGQSAMSSTLGRLRQLFDDSLLLREGRTMILSPFAEQLIDPVRSALSGVQEVLNRADHSFDPQRDQRTFTIMSSDYLTLVLLQPFLIHLHENHPGIRLHIQPLRESFGKILERNQVDLLIVPRQALPTIDEHRSQLLFTDRMVCAVAMTNDAVGPTISAEEFSSIPYIRTEVGTLPSIADRQLDALGVPRNVELTTSMTLAPFLIRNTRLMALIHERLGRLVAHEVDLRLVECPHPLATIDEMMVWTSNRDLDPGLEWLREQLTEHARKIL